MLDSRRTLLSTVLAAGLAAATALAPAVSSAASRWFRGTRLPARASSGTAPAQTSVAPSVRARHYLVDHARALGLPRIGISPAVSVRAWQNRYIVRFEQSYRGLPVFGRGALVRLDSSGHVDAVVTFAAADLDLIVVPSVGETEAQRAAADHWAVSGFGRPEVELGVFDDRRGGRLVWRVLGLLSSGRVRTLVDAVSGAVVRSSHLARHAQGTVYLENPTTTPTPQDVELFNLDAPEDSLDGRSCSVYHYVSGQLEQGNVVTDQLATSDGTGFFYQPSQTQPTFDDPFSEVNVYYHADEIDTYFRSVHGFNPSRSLDVTVNYSPGGAYDNAFFTPLTSFSSGLFFGQGGSKDFAYDGDVVKHEFTHYIIHEAVALGTAGDLFDENGIAAHPGAIHEGISDYFPSTMSGNPRLGEYALGAQARDLQNTLRCPDSMLGESHFDGEVIGGTTWAIREAIGATLADQVIFGGLLMIPPDASFKDLADGIITAAATMLGDGTLTQQEHDDVIAVIQGRGLDICDRQLPLDGNAVRTTNLFGYDFLGSFMGVDCATIRGIFSTVYVPGTFQYKVDIPAAAGSVTFHVQQSPATDLLYQLFVRRGSPITYDMQPLMGGFAIPFANAFDYNFGDFTEGDVSITVDTNSDPPLVPGETYYLAIGYQNCPQVQIAVSAALAPAPPLPDAGVGGDGGGDAGPDGPKKGGCGCAAGPGSDGLPVGLLLVLCIGWRVRRRRHR